MKTVPYRLIIILLAIVGLQSCLRTIEIPVLGDASGAIIKVSTPTKTAQTQTFTIDVHVVDASGNYVNNLGKSNFAIKDTNSNPNGMAFSLIDVKGGNKTAYKGDYNVFLLLDQSGSIDATDPDNLRIKASQTFLDALGKGDKVALGSFTTGSRYSSTNGYTLLHGGFTSDGSKFYTSLDSLQNIISKGNTPLYTSAEWAINYTAANSSSQNKALVLFTDGINNGGSTKENTENLSRQKNVPIFTVGLSDGVNYSVLSSMALNTGGSFMWAKDAKQLISYFGTLGNLLRGNADYYTLTFQATANSFSTAGTLLYLQVTLPNGKKFLMPYIVKFV